MCKGFPSSWDASASNRSAPRNFCKGSKSLCLVCDRHPCDAHHLRFAQLRALGRKVSDEFTVPLCRGHHREVHRSGDERAWWKKAGIDPIVNARTLWLKTHPLPALPNVSGSDQTTSAILARLNEMGAFRPFGRSDVPELRC